MYETFMNITSKKMGTETPLVIALKTLYLPAVSVNKSESVIICTFIYNIIASVIRDCCCFSKNGLKSIELYEDSHIKKD